MIHPIPAHILSTINKYESAAYKAAILGNESARAHFRRKARTLCQQFAAGSLR